MQKHIKVAYYLPRFPSLSETFILREMLLLRKVGLDIQIFSLMPPRPSPTMHQQAQEMMPYVHYSPYLFSLKLVLAHAFFLIQSPIKYFRAFWRAIWQTWPEPKTLGRVLFIFPKSVYFAKQLIDMKVNHIHAHFVWVNGVAAQIASDLTGIPYSIHAHAFDIFMRNNESVRRQLNLASGIVTVSEYHRRYLSDLCPKWCPEDIHVVHYGLDPDEFSPRHVAAADDATRIISVGRLEEKKGHEYLIDACALLAKKGYSFRCSIISDGLLRDELQARIEKHQLGDKVILLGAKNQAEVQNLYRHSDIFALPCVIAKSGDRDGMPNVLLEAMAMQIPVVTTPVTGNPELVHHGQNGLLVPERDAQALALAIECLINDPSLRHKLGDQARKTIIRRFDIRDSAVKMAEIFQEINRSPTRKKCVGYYDNQSK